jgi:hypothetical protein
MRWQEPDLQTPLELWLRTGINRSSMFVACLWLDLDDPRCFLLHKLPKFNYTQDMANRMAQVAEAIP